MPLRGEARPRPDFLVRLAHWLNVLLLLAGCDTLSRKAWFEGLLSSAEELTQRAHRLITPRKAMAREYTEADLSLVFPVNGTTHPGTAEYLALVENNFADWRLEVGGRVEQPARFSLAALRDLLRRLLGRSRP